MLHAIHGRALANFYPDPSAKYSQAPLAPRPVLA
ncbi:MAG: hypothetical protein JG774_1630 [Desulfomicrobiaceae bacterium]|jgi:hypothetical protein|nr:hypothetical protein [Desulfomicrobiaceae bacterium]